MYLYMYISIYVYIYICIYLYMYIYIYVYMQIYFTYFYLYLNHSKSIYIYIYTQTTSRILSSLPRASKSPQHTRLSPVKSLGPAVRLASNCGHRCPIPSTPAQPDKLLEHMTRNCPG